jgi:hypothetical protein
MVFIGIDNGADGAIAALDGNRKVIHQEVAPVINVGAKGSTKRIPNVQRMAQILRQLVSFVGGDTSQLFAVLEKAQPYPREGAVTSFNYGRGYGAWEAALVALGIPYEIKDPKEWQAVVLKGIEGGDTKAKALLKVQRMVPGLQTVLPRCSVPHLGLPDAACMALYALHVHKAQVIHTPRVIPPPPPVPQLKAS